MPMNFIQRSFICLAYCLGLGLHVWVSRQWLFSPHPFKFRERQRLIKMAAPQRLSRWAFPSHMTKQAPGPRHRGFAQFDRHWWPQNWLWGSLASGAIQSHWGIRFPGSSCEMKIHLWKCCWGPRLWDKSTEQRASWWLLVWVWRGRQDWQLGVLERPPWDVSLKLTGEMGDWRRAESSRCQAECCGMCLFLKEGSGRF